MTTTNTIRLNGNTFQTEEKARQSLQAYLDTLANHYRQQTEGEEIMQDIESRLAELLTGYLQEGKREILTEADAERAIATIGRPEEIFEEDPYEQAEATVQQESFPQASRRLHRSKSDRLLGGVAGGIALRWGIPAGLVRLAFILFACFTCLSIPLYLLLWIFVPTASPQWEEQMARENRQNSQTEEKDTGASRRKKSTRRLAIAVITIIFCILLLPAMSAFSMYTGFLLDQLFPDAHLFLAEVNGEPSAYGRLRTVMRILQLCMAFIPLLILFHFVVQAVSTKRCDNKRFLKICVIAWIAAFLLLIVIGIFGKSKPQESEDPFDRFRRQSTAWTTSETDTPIRYQNE